MYQSNQARAIISLGFPQGAGRPPNPSRHPVNSAAGTVARQQPPSLLPPQSSQSHLPPPPCATTAPRSRRARVILRPPSHAYNLRPHLGRDPIPINLVSGISGSIMSSSSPPTSQPPPRSPAMTLPQTTGAPPPPSTGAPLPGAHATSGVLTAPAPPAPIVFTPEQMTAVIVKLGQAVAGIRAVATITYPYGMPFNGSAPTALPSVPPPSQGVSI